MKINALFKNILAGVLAIIAIITSHAQGLPADFTIDGIYYAVDNDNSESCSVVGCDQTLTEVNVPSTVTNESKTFTVGSIAENAFYMNTALVSVTIPNTVTEIGEAAFYLCSSLTSINLGESLELIDVAAFNSCGSLTSVDLPESLKVIASGAFQYCGALVDISIPADVEYIGERAFDGCGSIQELVLPEQLEIIGGGTFDSCESLEDVTLGRALEQIGKDSFNNCESLKAIRCKSMIPPQFDGGFEEKTYTEATLYVPDDAMDAYRNAAPWKNFAKIEPNSTGIGDITVAPADDDDTIYDLSGRVVDNPISGKIYIRKGEKFLYTK